MTALSRRARETFLAIGSALAGASLVPVHAGAATIDFNGLTGGSSSPFTSYTESGFTVAASSSGWLAEGGFGNPAPSVDFETPPTTTASVVVTDNGLPFIFRSLDLYSSISTIPYTFTGTLNGNTEFSVSGTAPNTFGNFASVSNSDGTAVIDTLQVTIANGLPSRFNEVGIDNVVVATPASMSGDPHVITFDGKHYDLQVSGEFTLAKLTVAGNSFDVQVRTRQWWAGAAATVVSQVAIALGNSRVMFDLDSANAGKGLVSIDGVAAQFKPGRSEIDVTGGRIVQLSSTRYEVIWNTGEVLYVTDSGSYLNVDAWLAAEDGPGSIEGLLAESSVSDLEGAFADSSVVTDVHSLFVLATCGPSACVATPGAADPTVPEPASLALLSIGLVGFGVLRRH